MSMDGLCVGKGSVQYNARAGKKGKDCLGNNSGCKGDIVRVEANKRIESTGLAIAVNKAYFSKKYLKVWSKY